MKGELLTLGAAVAWGALWVQLVVIGFLNKSEKLYHDYIASGQIDLAYSFIETAKITPVLKKIFDKAQQSGQFSEHTDMEELLQSVDYAEYLDQIEKYYSEKKELEFLHQKQKYYSRLLWKIGLVHTLSVVMMPITYIFIGFGLIFYTFIIFSILTIVFTVVYLMRYESTSERFRKILENNRGN